MKRYVKQSVIAIILSISLTGLSCPSFAGQYLEKIYYGDLNLEQPDGVVMLYTRIQNAARSVCTDDTAIWGYHRKAFNRCFQLTMDKAVFRVDNPALTAIHQGRSERVAKR